VKGSENADTVYVYTIYTGCLGENVPDFGRMFKLKYTDIAKNTYIQS